LIAAGADVNAAKRGDLRPLHFACRFNATSAIVKQLLAAGANPSAIGQGLRTVLHHIALKAANLDSAKILIEADRSLVDARDNARKTPLMVAIEYNHPNLLEFAKLLLANGANANACDQSTKKTPLIVAIRQNRPNLM